MPDSLMDQTDSSRAVAAVAAAPKILGSVRLPARAMAVGVITAAAVAAAVPTRRTAATEASEVVAVREMSLNRTISVLDPTVETAASAAAAAPHTGVTTDWSLR